MPPMNLRTANEDSIKGYSPVETSAHIDNVQVPLSGDPAALHVTSTSANLMSITTGNSVPMRGVMPIEYMSDCDLYRFYPYAHNFDRIPKYSYSALFNAIK